MTAVPKNPTFTLGDGFYSIPELATILRLPQAKVRRWIRAYWDLHLAKERGTAYSWGKGRDKATNFYTLLEFYVFYELRERAVKTRTIFEAHTAMAEQIGTDYPFASAIILTDGRSILYTLPDGTTARADNSRQTAFRKVIEHFCARIEFSPGGLANRYWPLGQGHSIVVDPHHQFGQPVIEKTNVLAATLHELYQAGESKSFLSKLYDLPVAAVDDALAFYEYRPAA